LKEIYNIETLCNTEALMPSTQPVASQSNEPISMRTKKATFKKIKYDIPPRSLKHADT